MKSNVLLYILILTSFCLTSYSLSGQVLLGVKGGNFIGLEIGAQLSGIRKEDFVSNNISPRVNIYIGKELNSVLSIQVGYEGFYFNTIANRDRRYYNYYNLKLQHLLFLPRTNSTKNSKNLIGFQIGGGLFDNKYYKRPSFVADVGLVGLIALQNKSKLIFRINSILGWDLYQSDEDMISAFTLGLKRNL
jgi:hypothetical protein